MTESFILGLSSGSSCLITCGMVLFPYFMAGSAGAGKIATDISVFLLARLFVYSILATLAWYFGQALFTSSLLKTIIPGILYVIFAIMLIWYSIDRKRKRNCPARIIAEVENKRLVPLFLGFVNTLGFCPALLLIITKGAAQDTLAGSYNAFLAFFAGSSLWFLPLPFAGMFRKKEVIETIGILATGLAGILFVIKGITILIGGLLNG